MSRTRSILVGISLILGILTIVAASARWNPESLRVAAASDLAPAFRRIVPLFEKESGAKVDVILGSTGLLAKQVENGAPFDLLAAADEQYIRNLEDAGKIARGTRQLYAVGRIVVWTRSGRARAIKLRDLGESRFRRIAIANPRHAPYGRAAREALMKSGIWGTVESKLIYGENVLQAMQYAQSGGADAAIVAQSLAIQSNGVYSLVPESLYSPLRQALGVTSRSENPELAARFAAFVNGPRGRPIMREFGFRLPGERGR